MNFIESKRLIEYLDFLLQQGNAGTAPEIADKLGVSERTVRNYFETVREYKSTRGVQFYAPYLEVLSPR